MRRLGSLVARIPRAGLMCALVAFVNCLVWIVVTPPFHVPDETGHVVYAQHLAETGQPPDDEDGYPFSDELQATLVALRFGEIAGRPRERATPSEYYDSSVSAAREDPADPANGAGAIASSNQPPLYYSLAAAAYLISPWQDIQHRLWLMRLVSALLAALTTLFTFMFLRELLSQPWTWTVGALGGAFQPLFGFISSGVHPDALLFTACAGLFFGLARAFRRGLTLALGAGIGLALAVGVLAKLNFSALLPGAVLALGLLVWRAGKARPVALRGAAVGLAALVLGGLLFVGLNTVVFDRPASGRVLVEEAAGPATGQPSGPITRREQLSYTWQLYLPRLPFMNDQFTTYPLWQTFFKGGIGVFGWLDTIFRPWVYRLALGLSLPVLALLLAALWRFRAQLWPRWPELISYAVIALGVLGSIGFLGISYRRNTGNSFEQARYLLPLIPLYAAALALAARGMGARLERSAAAVIVALVLAHGLFAQLLVISRYYG